MIVVGFAVVFGTDRMSIHYTIYMKLFFPLFVCPQLRLLTDMLVIATALGFQTLKITF